MNIRNVENKDKQSLENICLETAADNLKKDNKAIENTLLLYNRYYFRAEKENSFVLTDDNGNVVGYVLCATDYKLYRRSFNHNELKEIKELGFSRFVSAKAEANFNGLFSGRYPAHLHIDIMPQYQGGGNGTRLIETLVNHLKNKGIKGIMLVTGADNKRAISFYKKNGFHKVINLFGAYVMAREI